MLNPKPIKAIENIENLSDMLMDEWKAKCLGFGYKPTITYDVTTSTATLHATRERETSQTQPDYI